jgi:hypothetical protein
MPAIIKGSDKKGLHNEAYADRAKEITDGKITTTKKLAALAVKTWPIDVR